VPHKQERRVKSSQHWHKESRNGSSNGSRAALPRLGLGWRLAMKTCFVCQTDGKADIEPRVC